MRRYLPVLMVITLAVQTAPFATVLGLPVAQAAVAAAPGPAPYPAHVGLPPGSAHPAPRPSATPTPPLSSG
ncbi:MAG: hypothetical protein ACRDG4_21305, partial [Chloroflexota bacterium]